MHAFIAKLGICFAAGCVGGLMNTLAVWVFGLYGITTALGVEIAPELTPAMLYHRVVWGGIWGLLFVLPIARHSIFWQGLILSLGPTLVQLLVVFPLEPQKGAFGLELGLLTPLFVIFFNAVWGWSAALWVSWSQKSSLY